MQPNINKILKEIKLLIDTSDNGRVLREGITTVICGRPNVGKSSLMNAFLKEKRVIVSPVPGTTRDVIEEVVNVRGLPLKIVDTAGIIDSEDLLTKEGVARSRLSIRQADLVLFLLDASEELSEKDITIMDEIKDKKTIVVVNKTDLTRKLDTKKINKELHDKKMVEVSVTKRKNLEKLEDAVTEMVWHGQVSPTHNVLVTNVRHKDALSSSFKAINSAGESLKKGLSAEFIAVGVKEAIDCLGLITGETVSLDILDRIFSQFCIGK